MPPLPTAADFPPEVLRLFDRYVHGQLDRRGFLDQAARWVGGGAAGATALLAALSPDFARAQVAAEDPRLRSRRIDFAAPAGHGEGRAYLVEPVADPQAPVVLVVHENRGLNPHIEDVARRLALAGYRAFAPDALHPAGGYPGDEDMARALFQGLDAAKTRQDFLAGCAEAEKLAGPGGRVGAVGFCWGGGMVNVLATERPALRAAAPFYGPAAPAGRATAIRAELLLVFAGQDERINPGWPPYEAELKAAGVPHRALHFPGTQHGFHNDTTPRFDAPAAAQAWAATLELFARRLRG